MPQEKKPRGSGRSLAAMHSFCMAASLALLCGGPAWGQGRLRTPPIEYTPGVAAPAGPVFTPGMPKPQRAPLPGGHNGEWNGYGFGGVPTYQWGHFGARYRPYHGAHRGYYGHQLQWSFRPGY